MTQWTFFVLQQIGYKVNIFNQNCEVFKLTNPFRPIGIPDTATYLGEAYLGSSESLHAGLKVQHWEDRSTSGKGVVWDLFLQQALLATLLKFLQMLALLCNITSSYVVTHECISHCHHQVCGLDPLYCPWQSASMYKMPTSVGTLPLFLGTLGLSI